MFWHCKDSVGVTDAEWIGKCFMVAVREETPTLIKATNLASPSWTTTSECAWNSPSATYREVACPDIL